MTAEVKQLMTNYNNIVSLIVAVTPHHSMMGFSRARRVVWMM